MTINTYITVMRQSYKMLLYDMTNVVVTARVISPWISYVFSGMRDATDIKLHACAQEEPGERGDGHTSAEGVGCSLEAAGTEHSPLQAKL